MKLILTVAILWLIGSLTSAAATVTDTLTDLTGKSLAGENVTVRMLAPNGAPIGKPVTVNDGRYSMPVPTNNPNIPANNQTFTLEFSRQGRVTRVHSGISILSDSNLSDSVPAADQMDEQNKPQCSSNSCCCECCRNGLFHRHHCRG